MTMNAPPAAPPANPALALLAEYGMAMPDNTSELHPGHLRILALAHEALAAHRALDEARTDLARVVDEMRGRRFMFDEHPLSMIDEAARFQRAHERVCDINRRMSAEDAALDFQLSALS